MRRTTRRASRAAPPQAAGSQKSITFLTLEIQISLHLVYKSMKTMPCTYAWKSVSKYLQSNLVLAMQCRPLPKNLSLFWRSIIWLLVVKMKFVAILRVSKSSFDCTFKHNYIFVHFVQIHLNLALVNYQTFFRPPKSHF